MNEDIATRLYAWLAERSIARGLPAPVRDHGGYRVDTHNPAEIVRWVFARATPAARRLAHSIDAPRYLLKLCGTDDDLRAIVPDIWRLHPPGYFMVADGACVERAPPAGYHLQVRRQGEVISAHISDHHGGIAASGHAAETAAAFIYDRIETAPQHRRRGLGQAVMTALRGQKLDNATTELLVATENGRALYETLGWRVLSPYATASIPER